MSNYGMAHWLAALEIVLYLMEEPGRCSNYRDLGPDRNCIVDFDCDASYADCPDTARSRYGVLGFMQGSFVIAKTGIMKNVRSSTLDAETGALAQATLQVLPVRRYLADWGFPQFEPTVIGEDNNAALLFSKSPVATRRSRHIHVDHHITREQQQEFGNIYVFRVPTDLNSADALSKNVAPALQKRHSARMFGEDMLAKWGRLY